MKRLITICAVLLMMGIAQAQVTTFTFNPNEWLNSYSTDITKTRIQQDGPRILIDGVSQSTDAVAGTHTTYAGASYSSTGISGFENRVPSVEIHELNMWLADGINAPNWGETMTQVLGGVLPSGTASNGWAAYTFDNPWPQAGVGTKLVGWYDVGYWDGDPLTDAHPLLFGNSDFDDFTLTVDLNLTDVYGNQVDLSVGASQRVWLGTMLPVEWTSSPDDLEYSGNRRYEGTMQMTIVPEPATICLLGLGALGLLRRKR
ncbi:MAG: PEP-CTERM sorting domain-containing protein [Phycisphaerae bacterium]|jgi:hypothetical protein